ncbi:MAG TPA: sigma 54-interacting transcriptional regulator, partial [bacterium]|nr:sigma 54-interacting transcriptional regulator [bacterium]
PNIVRVYDFGEDASHIYYTMDYYAGWSPYPATKSIDLPYLFDFSLQLLSALDYIHSRGVIHGDVKPSNIFEDASGVRRKFILGDFGLVRRVEGGTRYPVSGTMEYIAPEVFQGIPDDPRSDLYSFGILLFRVVASCLPFLPGDDISRIKRKPTYNYVRLSEVTPEVYPGLDEYVAALVQHNPADRFDSAYEAITALVELAKRIDVPLHEQVSLDTELALGKFFEYEREVAEVFKEGGKDGRGSEVFLLAGSGGVGKTSFIREAGKIMQLKGGLFLYVDCGGKDGALASLRRELGGAGAAAESTDADGAEGVSDSLETALVGTQAYRPTTDADTLRAFGELSERYGASLVALDNVDAADAGLAASTSRLLDYPYKGKVKFVIASRGLTDEAGSAFAGNVFSGSEIISQVKKFELRGFSAETTEAYLKYALGVTALDPALLRHVQDRAKGNPAVTRRIIEALATGGVIVRKLDGWHVDYRRLRGAGVPSASSDYFAVFLGRLRDDEQAALAAAGVYGHHFPAALIEEKTFLGKLVKAGIVAQREGIGAGYSFADAAVHSYVFEWARRTHAAEGCGRVVEFLRNNPNRDGEALAIEGRTYLLMGKSAEARGSLVEAGRLAQRSRDFEKAIELLEAALATEGVWEPGAYEEAVSDLAASYSALGDHRSALEQYETLARTGGGGAAEAERVLRISKERLALGDYGRPARDLEEIAPEGLAVDDGFLRHALLAWAYFGVKDFARAEECARTAEELAVSTGRKDIRAYIKYIKGVIFYDRGERDAALAELTEAARLAEEAGKLRLAAIALNLSGEVFVWRGEFDKAERAMRRGTELARKADDRYAVVSSLAGLGQVYFKQGYVKRAQREFELAEAECRLIANDELLSEIYASAGVNMIIGGEYRKAEFYFDMVEGLDTCPETVSAFVRYYRALICSETGELEKALEHLATAEDVLTRCRATEALNTVRSLRGRVFYLGGDLPRARDELEACLRANEEAGDRMEAAKVILTLGELAWAEGDAEMGESHLDEALARFTTLKNKYYMAACYLARARLKLSVFHEEPEADIIDQVQIDLENAKALFREIGVHKYRVQIFELEGDVFMARQRDREGEERLAKLAGDLKELSEQKNLDELLKFVLNYLTEELGADRGVIFLFDEHRNMLRIRGTAGIDDSTLEDASAISQTIIGQVAGSRKGVFAADAAQDLRFKDSASVQLQGIRSLLCLPLAAAGDFQGVVYLDSLERENLFREEDLNFGQIFARNAAYEIERRRREAESEHPSLGFRAGEAPGYGDIVGSSSAVRVLRSAVAAAAKSSVDVLVVGESGTGKELVVKMIHAQGPNADEPFIGINCAAIPEALLESELFGIERGTATGVDKRIGLFERAGAGTIFLDEVGAMDLNTQSKLLRVLQEKRFLRLGSRGHNTIPLRARVVSATNADLAAVIADGKFREDLFYRLNVFMIKCSPLREHKEDIRELLEHFISIYCSGAKKDRPRFSDACADILSAYDWPGNVRELENCVRYALANSTSPVIEPRVLPGHLGETPGHTPELAGSTLNESLARLERDIILKALRENDWVKAHAARSLDISETNLRYRMKKHGITEKDRFTIK